MSKPVSVETPEEIAERLVSDNGLVPAPHGVGCSTCEGRRKAVVTVVVEALKARDEAERDRITTAMLRMYWHFDCASERDTVLAIPHLPSCTCLAKDNQEATEYQHHHNSCPVYIRVTTIREGKE